MKIKLLLGLTVLIFTSCALFNKEVTITKTVTGSGTLTVSPDADKLLSNSYVETKAVPDAGWLLTELTGYGTASPVKYEGYKVVSSYGLDIIATFSIPQDAIIITSFIDNNIGTGDSYIRTSINNTSYDDISIISYEIIDSLSSTIYTEASFDTITISGKMSKSLSVSKTNKYDVSLYETYLTRMTIEVNGTPYSITGTIEEE